LSSQPCRRVRVVRSDKRLRAHHRLAFAISDNIWRCIVADRHRLCPPETVAAVARTVVAGPVDRKNRRRLKRRQSLYNGNNNSIIGVTTTKMCSNNNSSSSSSSNGAGALTLGPGRPGRLKIFLGSSNWTKCRPANAACMRRVVTTVIPGER